LKRIVFLPVILFVLGLIVLGCIGYEEKAIKVLVNGSPIHGANGIIFDSKDRLHIASLFGGEIVVMDTKNGNIIDRMGSDQGVKGPDDLIFGPDGSLYFTNLIVGEVGRLAPNGVNTNQSVSAGVNPITFSDQGHLFVALDFFGDELYELDPDLVKPPRLVTKDLGFLNGMDWGPDGFLYGPIWTQGKVVRIDVNNGTNTTVVDGLGIPAAVKFDSRGRLHIADHLRGEILRVNMSAGTKEVIATGLSGVDNLAFDSQDRLFVSNAQDGYISEILANGTKRTVSPGGMIAPGGVAVLPHPDGSESVFVADLFTLREFDGLTGKEMSIQRHYIGLPGSITCPMTVSLNDKNLVLTSCWNTVQVWDLNTSKVLEEYMDFAVPINAIRFQGDLVVAELGNESGRARIVRTSPEGRITLADFSDGITVPAGLAASENDLYVSDWATGVVLLIVADGQQLETPIQVAKGLSFPEGLAIDKNEKGNLLVVETGAGCISRIDTKTGKVRTVAKDLALGFETIPGMTPTYFFNGVAVGPSGTIYVTGDVANVLYRIEPEP
jgi:sugar lactone lactonase YvrE